MERKRTRRRSAKEESIEKSEPDASKIYFSSGSDRLDIALSNPFPMGKIVNLVGDKSSGKTLIVSELIYRARKRFGDRLKWHYDDGEDGYSFDSKAIWGYDMIHEDQPEPSNTVEEMGNNVYKFCEGLKDSEIGIYIVDSLDGLPAEMELVRARKQRELIEAGKSLEEQKGSFNQEKQKFMSMFFKEQAKLIRRHNVLFIVVSQVRCNIGVTFGAKYTRSGGKALDHYCNQIIWLAEAEKHKLTIQGYEVITGISIKANVTKNKSGKPFRTCNIDILFDHGIDNIATNLKFLNNLYTDSGKTSVIKTKKDKKGLIESSNLAFNNTYFKSINEAVGYVEQHNLQRQLAQEIRDKWQSIEDAAQPERQSKY